MENKAIGLWLSAGLQQMAAEAYLDDLDLDDKDGVIERLIDGNNNTRVIEEGSQAFRGKSRFTESMGEIFFDRFLIVNHHENDATGFSSTLFFDQELGSYTLSFRSTEYRNSSEGGDFERDGGIVSDGADDEILEHGFALAQLLAMERYYKEVGQILPLGVNLNVTGYSLGGHLATVFTELHAEEIERSFVFNSPGRGDLGRMGQDGSTEAEIISEMLLRLDEVLMDPSLVVPTFQSTALEIALFEEAKLLAEQDPAWDPFRAGSSQNIYHDPRYRWARKVIEREFSPDYSFISESKSKGAFSQITSIVGHATHRDGELVANSQNHAPANFLFIEDQPTWDERGGLWNGDGDYGTSHSLTLIVDSLALQYLFSELDANLDKQEIEEILAASGFQSATGTTLAAGFAEGDSLENALDALYLLFTNAGTRTPYARGTGGFGNIANREAFHGRINEIGNGVKGIVSPLHIEVLVGKSGREIEGIADDFIENGGKSITYRYALQTLNPFAVIGADYSIHNYNGELTIYDPTTGQGKLTREWIRDRASMLAAMNEARTNNQEDQDTGQLYAATGQTLYSFAQETSDRSVIVPKGAFLATRFVTFDGDLSAELFGGSLNDGLYGNGGDDTLFGFNGRDNLEGGEGQDILKGGADADSLYGGGGADNVYGESGDDKLDGGEGDDNLEGGDGRDWLLGGGGSDKLSGGLGNDRLEGGVGFDTYTFQSGHGVDTIADVDGVGNLMIEGHLIRGPEGGFRKIGNLWLGGSGEFGYALYFDGIANGAATVSISGQFQGQVRIEGFRNGDLGIDLGNFYESSQSISTTITTRSLGASSIYDETLFMGSSANDFAFADTDYAYFYGLGGNDVIGEVGNSIHPYLTFIGNGGNDVIVGGDNEDPSYGSDWLYGGGGADRIWGGKGNDELVGDFMQMRLAQNRFWVDFFEYSVSASGDDQGHYETFWSEDDIPGDHHFGGNFGGALKWVLGLADSEDLVLAYDDILDGGDGNDRLYGNIGSDQLYGGAGNDRLQGDSPVFRVEGSTNLAYLRDFLGNPGDDLLDGGAGDDTLVDDVAGNDILLGGAGNDSLTNLDRYTFTNESDRVYYLADRLSLSDKFSNRLDGGQGNDTIRSTNHFEGGFDVLIGGDGNDLLDARGVRATVVLDGGAGDDVLTMNYGSAVEAIGGSGNDRYSMAFYSDGTQSGGEPGSTFVQSFQIRDYETESESSDALQLLFLGTDQDLRFARSGLDLWVGTQPRPDWLVIENWFVGEAWKIEKWELLLLSPTGTSYIRSELDIADIEDKVTWKGTDGPDHLIGDSTRQTILGGGGDDILDGGGGDDVLKGGAGNNIFQFGFESGRDVILNDDPGGDDEVSIKPGLSQADIAIEQSGNDLLISAIGTTNVFVLTDWFLEIPGHVRSIRFSDGTTLNYSQMKNIALGNHAPFATQALDAVEVRKGSPFSFQLPSNLFADQDPGDFLSIGIRLASGEELPSWLTFDPTSMILRGLPPETLNAPLELRIHAIDRLGSEAEVNLDLVLQSENWPPLVIEPLSDQIAVDSFAFNFVIPENAFQDEEAGNYLTFKAVLESGNSLPSWMSFDPIQRRFTGTPDENSVGSVVVRVTGTDPDGSSVTDDFQVTVIAQPDIELIGGNATDSLKGLSGNDHIEGGGGSDFLSGRSGNDVLVGGAGNDHQLGEPGHDLLRGGAGNDYLDGGAGTDILNGDDGDDVLLDESGAALLFGGVGRDILRASGSSALAIGGQGDDQIVVGNGAAVVAFNRGDGKDRISGNEDTEIVLSIGRGIPYVDLAFSREGSDLVLETGATDRLTFSDWYAMPERKVVSTLQFVARIAIGGGGEGESTSPIPDNRVESFDFLALADAFDASGQVNGWSLMDALLSAHMSGSDTEALGGDAAYRYGLTGVVEKIGTASIQEIIGDPGFALEPQTIHVQPATVSANMKFARLGL